VSSSSPAAIARARTLPRAWRLRGVYVFLVPAFLLLIAFDYLPFALAIWRSFYDWNGLTIANFIGIQNYQEILNDRYFWTSVRVVGIILLFNLTLPLIGPILVAEAIFNLVSKRSQYFWRTLLIVPAVVPMLVHLLLWRFIYNPFNGPANLLLKSLGLPPQTWLADQNLALASYLAIGFPWAGGVWMLIYLAGLINIPNEVIDASIIDGASRFRRILHIDLPLIMGQIKLSLILTCIGTLQQFVGIFVLTAGGPNFATYVPGMYLYDSGFGRGRMGFASAVGVMIFVVVLALTYVNQRYMKSSVEYEAR
jgi:raffinose/stachyose/melibiose transport system permease protein